MLDATDWNDLQSTEATNEKRFAPLGIVDAVKDSTPFVDYIKPSDRERMRRLSSQRNLQIPVLQDQSVTVLQTPGFNFIPSNLPESANYSFTAVDVFSGFRHYPGRFDNNQLDEKWTKQEVMRNVAYGMGNTIESLIATVLENRKTQTLDYTTQISQSGGSYSFNAITDILEIDNEAQRETMFYSLKNLMEANELWGNYRVVNSRGGLAFQKAEALKNAKYNNQNIEALGFLPTDRMYESGNIAPEADVFNGWFFRDGAIGIIENFPYDFRAGTEINGRKWSISDVDIPYTRMRANIYTNNEATDATALVGAGTDSNLIMTHFQEMAIWLRFYIVYRYNSDLSARVNDIVKIRGLVA